MSNQREDDLCVTIYVPLLPPPSLHQLKKRRVCTEKGGGEQNGGTERHNLKYNIF